MSDVVEARASSTLLLILVVLKDARLPMTTYEIGLAVCDDKRPPRPISVLMKTLLHDGYVERDSLAGKRVRRWRISHKGIASLDRRPEAAHEALRWLSMNPNRTKEETIVLDTLRSNGPLTASALSTKCDLPHSPIRTALKRLVMRHDASYDRDRGLYAPNQAS